MGHKQVGHREQGRVHDTGRPGEEENTPFRPGQGHEDHADAVDQLAADVDGSCSKNKTYFDERNSLGKFYQNKNFTQYMA